MPDLYLVSCVATKRQEACAAKDLYTSPWFRKARAYVERQQARWFILSAKHGLLDPEKVIEPYERTLSRVDWKAKALWAAHVAFDLRHHVNPGDRVFLLAGETYRKALLPQLQQALGLQVDVPMEGLQIGEQLNWFNAQLYPGARGGAR